MDYMPQQQKDNGVKEQNTMMFQKEGTLVSYDKRSDIYAAASMIQNLVLGPA
jgi:hypothetical protein